MGINGDDFLLPVMNQDLASASMQPMPLLGMLPSAGTYNTNLLGGVKMQEQLDKDRVQLMHEKEQKGMSLLKKVGLVVVGLGALGFVKFAPIRKWISSKCTQAVNWGKNLFKKTPPTPTIPPPPPAP